MSRTTSRGAGLVLSFAMAGSAAAAMATSASATAGYGPYLTLASPSLNVRSAPFTSAGIVGSLPYHTTIYLACQTSGSLVGQSTVWDELTNGSYVSDYWTSTQGKDTWTTSIPRCPTTGPVPPPPPPSGVKIGKTVSNNEGSPGQCTSWAINQFHGFTGYYPDFVVAGNNGDAQYWAGNAATNGWTVSATPRVDSIVVFQPGKNGAKADGHVAWVTKVSGKAITFTEMNGTAGPYKVDTRTVTTPDPSTRYIYAP